MAIEKMTPIGRAIRARGKTVQGVAEDLGLTRGAVYKWVNGEAVPDKNRMNEVCKYLKISPNQVYGFTR